MTFQLQQAVRAVILLTFCIMLFNLHYTGEITKLVNPKYLPLSQIASIIFLILFYIQITRIWITKKHSHPCCHHEDHDCGHNHDHGDAPINLKKLVSYLILTVPLMTGFLLPPKVLDTTIADKKGAMIILSNQLQQQKPNIEENPEKTLDNQNIYGYENSLLDENHEDSVQLDNPNEISKEEFEQIKQNLDQSTNIVMNDAIYATYYDQINLNINQYKGREIQLTGFVYKGDDLEQNQLVIARFLITHCVADASVIGFLAKLPDASSLQENSWIEATGVLDISNYNGTELPIIKMKKWKIISEPNQPYLYPLSVKLL